MKPWGVISIRSAVVLRSKCRHASLAAAEQRRTFAFSHGIGTEDKLRLVNCVVKKVIKFKCREIKFSEMKL